MEPVTTAALIGAGAMGVGALAGTISDSRQSGITRRFNAREAAKNRDWQERMSNTAHQRQVADMRAAGLNPILSVMGGGGSATPSGSAAQAANAQFGHHASGAGRAIGEAAMLRAQLLTQQSQIKLNEANAAKALAEAGDISATQLGRLGKLDAEGQLIRANVSETAARTVLHKSHVNESDARTIMTRAQVDHVREQISQLKRQGRLTDAQVDEVFSRVVKNYAEVSLTENRIIESSQQIERNRLGPNSAAGLRGLQKDFEVDADYWSGVVRRAVQSVKGKSIFSDRR